MNSSNDHKSQQGVGLVEVLITLLVLSVGLLGMASLQLNAMKFNQLASVRSQANVLAYDIADRMRANRDSAKIGAYVISVEDEPTGSSIAEIDLQQWRNLIDRSLPDGRGSIAQSGDKFTITIIWDESRIDGIDAQQNFIYETRI